MAEPFVGEIRMFGGNFAPVGWAFCDGSVMPIADNEALFTLIGTIYGGNGVTTFALPDLRGRVPVHQGGGGGVAQKVIGQSSGVESVTLNQFQMPAHSHALFASTAASSPAISRSAVLGATQVAVYGSGVPSVPMAATAITVVGGGQPHNNVAPVVALSFIIALFGIFPSQN
jgi:microcystin-dependent protein